MKTSLLKLTCGLALAGVCATASGQTTFNWTFTTTNDVVDGYGTMQVNTSSTVSSYYDSSVTGYQVISFSGTFLGQTIDSLLSTNLYGGNDNLIHDLTGTVEQLDAAGISFTYGLSNISENLFKTGGYPNGDGALKNSIYGTFVAVAPAPEPTTLALAALGGASLLLLCRRK